MGSLLLHYYATSNGALVTNSYSGQTWAQAQTLITAAAAAGTICRLEWRN